MKTDNIEGAQYHLMMYVREHYDEIDPPLRDLINKLHKAIDYAAKGGVTKLSYERHGIHSHNVSNIDPNKIVGTLYFEGN